MVCNCGNERERENEEGKKSEFFRAKNLSEQKNRKEKGGIEKRKTHRNLFVLLCSDAASSPADSASRSSAACDAATTAGETEFENRYGLAFWRSVATTEAGPAV